MSTPGDPWQQGPPDSHDPRQQGHPDPYGQTWQNGPDQHGEPWQGQNQQGGPDEQGPPWQGAPHQHGPPWQGQNQQAGQSAPPSSPFLQPGQPGAYGMQPAQRNAACGVVLIVGILVMSVIFLTGISVFIAFRTFG